MLVAKKVFFFYGYAGLITLFQAGVLRDDDRIIYLRLNDQT